MAERRRFPPGAGYPDGVDTRPVPPPGDHDELRPSRGPARRDPSVSAPGADLSLALSAEMVAPSLVRGRVDRWLASHRWPSGQRDDLVLAVSEAVSNSVEHGYRVGAETTGHAGVVEVRGEVVPEADHRRHVVITIRDHGAWRPAPPLRGNRRHGIPLMTACVDVCTVEGTSRGTTVVLRSRTVPVPLDPI